LGVTALFLAPAAFHPPERELGADLGVNDGFDQPIGFQPIHSPADVTSPQLRHLTHLSKRHALGVLFESLLYTFLVTHGSYSTTQPSAGY
jgi:hypothetical protein